MTERTYKIRHVHPPLLDAIQRGIAKFVVTDDLPLWMSGDVVVIEGTEYKVTYVHAYIMPEGQVVLGIERML